MPCNGVHYKTALLKAENLAQTTFRFYPVSFRTPWLDIKLNSLLSKGTSLFRYTCKFHKYNVSEIDTWDLYCKTFSVVINSTRAVRPSACHCHSLSHPSLIFKGKSRSLPLVWAQFLNEPLPGKF